jgi:hypothetical protein
MAYGGINASGVFVAPIAPLGSFGVFIDIVLVLRIILIIGCGVYYVDSTVESESV